MSRPPHTHTAATTLAGASCPLGHLRGQREICYSDTLSAIYQRANTSGNIPRLVPDWLALNIVFPPEKTKDLGKSQSVRRPTLHVAIIFPSSTEKAKWSLDLDIHSQ